MLLDNIGHCDNKSYLKNIARCYKKIKYSKKKNGMQVKNETPR
jgi:hypothetical protein